MQNKQSRDTFGGKFWELRYELEISPLDPFIFGDVLNADFLNAGRGWYELAALRKAPLYMNCCILRIAFSVEFLQLTTSSTISCGSNSIIDI